MSRCTLAFTTTDGYGSFGSGKGESRMTMHRLKLFILNEEAFTTRTFQGGVTVRVKKAKRVFDGFQKIKPATWYVEVLDQDGVVTKSSEIQTHEVVDYINNAEAENLVVHTKSAVTLIHLIACPRVSIDLTDITSDYFEVDAVAESVLKVFCRSMNLR